MSGCFRRWAVQGAVVIGSTLGVAEAFGCATCLGAPDSPLTHGLNMGILSLLLVVMLVLSGVVAFFVHVARRAAAIQARGAASDSVSRFSDKVTQS